MNAQKIRMAINECQRMQVPHWQLAKIAKIRAQIAECKRKNTKKYNRLMARLKDCETIYISHTKVRAMGWTDEMIDMYLGGPDKEVINQHYRSGPYVRLYDRERVFQVMRRPEVSAHFLMRALG